MEIAVTDKAIALRWNFFGPLLTTIVEALGTGTSTDLKVIQAALHDVIASIQHLNHSPGTAKTPPITPGTFTDKATS